MKRSLIKTYSCGCRQRLQEEQTSSPTERKGFTVHGMHCPALFSAGIAVTSFAGSNGITEAAGQRSGAA